MIFSFGRVYKCWWLDDVSSLHIYNGGHGKSKGITICTSVDSIALYLFDKITCIYHHQNTLKIDVFQQIAKGD